MTDDIRRDALSGILRSYAVLEEQQAIIDKMHNDKEITTKDYVMALADGLLYGNWPWIIHSQPKSLEKGCEK